MKHVLLCGLLLLCAATPWLQAAEDPDAYNLHVTNWAYGRERKTTTSSNRVTATFNLKNVSTADMKSITLTLSYFTGMGEKVNEKPITASVESLKAGETREVKLAGDFIPIFSAYAIEVSYAGLKKPELWRSSSDVGQPEAQNGGTVRGAANVVILGKEAGLDKTGHFKGKVRVKNEGTVEARNMKITVTYTDAKNKKAGEWTGTLGKGALGAGVEQAIDFAAATAPRVIGGYELKVSCDEPSPEAGLSAIEFSKEEMVEFAKFSFKRKDPKSAELNVSAQVRNGFSVTVNSVKLTLVFLGVKKKEMKRFTFEMPGELKSGEIKPVEFSVSDLPNYDSFEQLVDYKRLDGKAAAGSAEPRPAPKFENTNDVEVIFTDSIANEDKSVTLVGGVRNGKNIAVKDIAVTATFTMPAGDPIVAVKTITDVMQPGEERKFVLKSPNTAGFQLYNFSFKYNKAE
jgi:SLAP domain-containing protein